MRLIDIKKSINFASDNFNLTYKQIGGGNNIQMSNIEQLRASIQALLDVDLLPNEDPYDFIVNIYSDTVIIDPNKHPDIIKKLEYLRYYIPMLNRWVNKYITTEDSEDIINIKLPTINDLDMLTKSCSMIDKALTQSVSEFGGEVKFKHLDYGSSWIVISVTIGNAALFVMGLAKVACFIAKKYYQIKLMQKEYERYSMGNDIIKTIKEANEKIIEEEFCKKANEIDKEFYKDKEADPERVRRIKVAISELTKLMEMGGEIHGSSLLADSKDSKIDYKTLSLMQPQALLDDDNNKDDDDDENK